MKKGMLSIFFLCSIFFCCAQQKPLSNTSRFADFSVTAGSSQAALAVSYVHNWYIGKKKKWEAGLGLRSTSSFGTKKDFITAPAKVSRSTTTPFVIVFAGQKTENWDTLNIQSPFVNSVNISINLGYNFNQKWSAGFNIDLIGFSFGRKTSAVLTSDGITKEETSAKPTFFNVLLTGDNDYGSLNSEFFIKYAINEKWRIKAIYQFYFSEYKTTTIKQITPNGTAVDRFRNKANMLGVGVAYHF